MNVNPSIPQTPKPPKDAVLKVFFNRQGKAERTVLLISSGNKERDALCLKFAGNSSIPIPRLGTKLMGELWRRIIIKSDVIFTFT